MHRAGFATNSIFSRSTEPDARYCYDRFPPNFKTEEQEEKRKQILAAATGAIEYSAKQNMRCIIREILINLCSLIGLIFLFVEIINHLIFLGVVQLRL